MKIIQGQHLPLSSVGVSDQVEFSAYIRSPFEIDFACFGLDKKLQINDLNFVVFYNNLSAPAGAVRLLGSDLCHFKVDLRAIPSSIDRLVFTASSDGTGQMKDISSGLLEIVTDCEVVGTGDFSGAMFGMSGSVILAEIYRLKGKWHFHNALSGLPGGLASLIQSYGGDVENEPSPMAPPPSPAIAIETKIADVAPGLKALTKKALACLNKKGLAEVKARIVLVLDASESMRQFYETGHVQEVLNRLLPLAASFDEEARVEVVAFNSKSTRLSCASLYTYRDFINLEAGGWKMWEVGAGAYEPAQAIEEVMGYLGSSSAKTPTYVLLLTAGSPDGTGDIAKLLEVASSMPCFWQVVSIPGAGCGNVAEGRTEENFDVLALDDLNDLPVNAFYDQILDKFPNWLEMAEENEIIEVEY